MSEIPSTEEILRRMRAHASLSSQPSQSVPPVDDQMKLGDFSPLLSEIRTATEGTRQVGQLNPRNSGLHNNAIQFAKRVMRRSLAWYTRPLHYFQGGVVRALEQVNDLLQGHEENLRNLSREVTVLRSALEQRSLKLDEMSSRLKLMTFQLDNRFWALEQRITRFGEEFEVAQQQKLKETADSTSLLFAGLKDEIHALAGLREQVDGITSLREHVHTVRSEFAHLTNELAAIKVQNRLRDRDQRRFFHDLEPGATAALLESKHSPTPAMFPSEMSDDTNFDYFRFEELHRGDEALIAARQREYLELFRGRDDVLDVGCGRGEFLELLRDIGICAKGVDSGTDQYLLCKEKGLDVVQGNLFSYLESLPDESLGGLFSAQVIEHLTASDQLRFVSLAYRKTRSGSPVVLETINAQSVFALSRNFFLDPTHIRPVHPETLKFAMESAKFRNVELRFSGPLVEPRIPPLKLNGEQELEVFNRAIGELNQLIYGNLDYAAIGWR